MRRLFTAAGIPFLSVGIYAYYPDISAFLSGAFSSRAQLRHTDLLDLTLTEALHGLEIGDCTSEELVLAYLARIKEVDNEVHAILRLNPNALEQAREADRLRLSGKSLGKLHGVPILIKDKVAVMGMPTTAGSLALKDSEFPTNATIAQKLVDAGAIVLPKTALSQWIETDCGSYEQIWCHPHKFYARHSRYNYKISG